MSNPTKRSATASISGGASLKKWKSNGLSTVSNPSRLEKIYDYEPGGHHPVHLRDLLNKRYKVIHKLGSGGYSTVWLCSDITNDTPRYVALKIIIADASTKDCPELRTLRLIELGFDKGPLAELFCLPLDKFDIEGPNGLHYVFVYPVLGPRVKRLVHVLDSEDPDRVFRKICLQATEAMAALHSHGVCHGDFRPANILLQISGLDGLSEDAVLKVLGEPETNKVRTWVDGNRVPHSLPTAPQYLVYPIYWDVIDLSDVGADFLTDKACVIDLGESYDVSNLPPDLGIPPIYHSPEYTLEKKIGFGTDIWALGCTLFEIRTGKPLFDSFDNDMDDILWTMALVLGKFPEPWWSTTWKARKRIFEDHTDESGRVVEVKQEVEDWPDAIQQPRARCFQDVLARGFNYFTREGSFYRDISPEESDLFSELLTMLFKYNPDDRLTAQKALGHAWFKL